MLYKAQRDIRAVSFRQWPVLRITEASVPPILDIPCVRSRGRTKRSEKVLASSRKDSYDSLPEWANGFAMLQLSSSSRLTKFPQFAWAVTANNRSEALKFQFPGIGGNFDNDRIDTKQTSSPSCKFQSRVTFYNFFVKKQVHDGTLIRLWYCSFTFVTQWDQT